MCIRDRAAIERGAASIEVVDLTAGGGGPGSQMQRIYYGSERTKQMAVMGSTAVSYTHLRAHETVLEPVCRLLLEKKKKKIYVSATGHT